MKQLLALIYQRLSNVRIQRRWLIAPLVAYACYALWPFQLVEPGFAAVRFNRLGGSPTVLSEGPVLVIPYVHSIRSFPMREQIYQSTRGSSARSEGAFQTIEGLPIGVEVTVRYVLDPAALIQLAMRWPDGVDEALIKPTIEAVLHKILAAHTVRDVYSSKRDEIQTDVHTALTQALDVGVQLRSVSLGRIDLPSDYKKGLEQLLNEELATERMRYTLQLKAKEVEQRSLEAEADKVAREKAAEAAAKEVVIAAKGQEEAMRHVLPFKEREIEQRRLEAEAMKIRRTKEAEGEADARRIEANGEADARKKLAEADAFRIDVTGKASTAQLERDSVLIARNPLLIQKSLVDKLSDKIQVIVAPPAAGGFFAGGLLGQQQKQQPLPPAPKDEDSND